MLSWLGLHSDPGTWVLKSSFPCPPALIRLFLWLCSQGKTILLVYLWVGLWEMAALYSLTLFFSLAFAWSLVSGTLHSWCLCWSSEHEQSPRPAPCTPTTDNMLRSEENLRQHFRVLLWNCILTRIPIKSFKSHKSSTSLKANGV